MSWAYKLEEIQAVIFFYIFSLSPRTLNTSSNCLSKNKDCQLDLVSYMTVERPTGVQSGGIEVDLDTTG